MIKYTEEELERLIQEEDELTDETIAIILYSLGVTLEDLEKEIRSFYSKYGKDGIITYQEARKWISNNNHVRRLTFLNGVVNDLCSGAFGEIEKTFEHHLIELINKECEFFGFDSSNLDIDKILNIKWSEDNLNWRQRLVNYHDNFIYRINSDTKVAIIRQDSLSDYLINTGKRFETMDNVLKRWSNSETKAVQAQTRYEIFKASGVKYYTVIVDPSLDNCSPCLYRESSKIPISAFEVGITAPPFHPNCGCEMVPYLVD